MYTTDRAIREGKSMLEMMSLPVKNAFGKDITPNYAKHVVHVEQILAELEGRRGHCRDMAEVRRLKLAATATTQELREGRRTGNGRFIN